MENKKLLIGAHLSIAGGFDKAINSAEELKATCVQIFTKSNRQWKAKKISSIDAKKFIDKQKNSSIQIVVAHAAYLINLGSKTDETINKSIDSLAEELQRCEVLNIPYLVLHPGTIRFNEDEEKSLQFIAQNIDAAFAKSQTKNVTLLLETMAGQGTMTGRTFEQLAIILKKSNNQNRIGICFDTCHAFAAGYEFWTPKTYQAMWQKFDQLIGLQKLKVFHMNDSQKPAGSRVDRHDHIAEGKIPIQAFELIMQDKTFTNIPKILETPAGENEVINNIKNLKKLAELAKK